MIIHNFEQGSPEWCDMRCGKVTGTTLKVAVGSTNLTLVDKLIAEQLTGYSEEMDFTDEDMQRGIDYEPHVRQDYIDLKKVDVVKAGFIQCSRREHFGFSPDGLVYEKDKLVGGVEIKCPKTKTHVKYIRMGQLPNEYKYQVYAPFLICPTVQWWDFISWDNRLAVQPRFIHRTYRDTIQKELEETEKELDKFFIKLNKYKKEIEF